MIELLNRHLRVAIDPDRGGDIVFVGAPSGPNALFHEPWDTPVPAAGSMSYGSGTLDWLSHYRGGWQVMFPNAGAECVADGVTHPLHGEVSCAPAEVVEATRERVTLRSPTRLPVRLVRSIHLSADRPALMLVERAENQSDFPQRYVWGHHPAVAATAGMRVDLPARGLQVDPAFDDATGDLLPGSTGIWPLALGRDGSPVSLARRPDHRAERVCYLAHVSEGWGAVRDPSSGRGVGLAWDRDAFPHLWLWQQFGGPRFPFYGRAQLIGIEPVSYVPGDGLAAAIERGEARTLAPKGSASAWITMALFPATDDTVLSIDRLGRVSTDAA